MIWQPKQLEAAKLLSDPTKKRILLRGGRRSGKTFTIAHFLRLRALNYPGCKQLIARKTLKNAAQSVWLETMLPILKADQAVKLCKIYRQPNLAEYKNGSLILLGGLAPNEIDDALGKEYSTIYPNECSEISYNVIPPLVSSLNERAIHKDTGAAIVPKLLLDCNPPTVKHWSYSMFMLGIDPVTKEPLKQREIYGTLQMNPGDNLPNLAEGYYESLEAMSPRDRQRYLLGEYGQLAGLVFDNFDPERHVYDSVEIGKDWRLFRAIDFGFTNPFVCLWAYYDPANETLYVEDEHYQAGVTTPAHAEIIKQRTGARKVEATVADHDAGDRKILQDHGIPTEKADKDVPSGINQLYDGFNRGKVLINRRCTNLIDEIYSYQWKESSTKDEPVKEKDHAIDALRYLYKRFAAPPPKPMFIRAN